MLLVSRPVAQEKQQPSITPVARGNQLLLGCSSSGLSCVLEAIEKYLLSQAWQHMPP